MIEGILRFPLEVYEDERGWFCELRRDSLLPKPMVQTNLSVSRAGVVRGLHFHERGQDDLFACLSGTPASSSSTARPGRRSPRTSATRTASRSTSPGSTRTASRR